MQWPEAQPSIAAILTPKPATRRAKHGKYAQRTERKEQTKEATVHLTRAAEHERAERHRRPEHARSRARGSAEGHRADLMSRIRAVAALFSPAQATR